MQNICIRNISFHRFAILGAALCIAAHLASPRVLRAQSFPPKIRWEKSLGGSLDDELYALCKTSDGGVLAVGGAKSNDSDVSDHIGVARVSDYWIVKLDEWGRVQWKRSYGGTGEDVATSVVQTTDGGFAIAGWSGSSDGDISDHRGASDFWILKIDSVGTKQWATSCGGTRDDRAMDIHQANDGGFIVAGSTQSNDGDVNGWHGGEDMWIVKITSAGAFQWGTTLGGSMNDDPAQVIPTNDNGFIVAGYSESSNNDFPTNLGSSDAWIVKLDANGNVSWKKSFGGSDLDEATSIYQTSDNGYLFAGSTASADGSVVGKPTPAGNGDAWLVKLDKDGAMLWQRLWGGTNIEAVLNLEHCDDGSYLLDAATSSTDGDVTGFHGGNGGDTWLVNVTPLGDTAWEHCYGGSQNEWFSASESVELPDGDFILGTTSYSNDGDVTGNHGLADYWIARVGYFPSIDAPARVTMSDVECGPAGFDTIYVHNRGNVPLTITSATFAPATSTFTLAAPTAFPLDIAAGDSARFVITFTWPSVGQFAATLDLASNDSLPGRSPWAIAVAARKDSIGFFVSGVRADTIDMGTFTCNVGKDTTFIVSNTSSIATECSFITAGSGLYTVTPPLLIPAGTRQPVGVRFAGSTSAGVYTGSVRLLDNCGRADTITLVAHVDSAILAIATVRDTTVCPGAPAARRIVVRNLTATTQVLLLGGFDPAFSIAPDSLVLPAGDSGTLRIDFVGAAQLGAYTVHYDLLDHCGGAHRITATVHVDTATFTADAVADTSVCPGDSVTRVVVIHNTSRVAQTALLVQGDPLFAIVPDSVTLAPGARDTLHVRFLGSSDTGAHTVHYQLPGCAGVHEITATVDVVPGTVVAAQLIPDTTACPGGEVTRVVTVQNLSRLTQRLTFPDTNIFFRIAPASVTLAPGDSIRVTIQFLGGPSGTYTLAFELPGCGVQHVLTATVRVGSSTITSSPIVDTTICLNTATARECTIHNLSSTDQTLVFTGDTSMFTVRPDSAALAPGDSLVVRVTFRGAPNEGTFMGDFQFYDACGFVHHLAANVRVDTGSVDADAIADTTVCPGVAVQRRVVVRNVSQTSQQFRLESADTLFAVVPDSLSLASGDTSSVIVTFRGAVDTGHHAVRYTLPGCGARNAITATVMVAAPRIGVARPSDVTICPGNRIFIPLTISNGDAVARILSATSTDCGLSRTLFTLAASQSDTIVATFAPHAAGTYPCVVHIVDECGVTHDITFTVNVTEQPSLQLALQTPTDTATVSNEIAVAVVATPASARTTGTLSFSVGNEPTALLFDSASAPCGITIVRGDNTVQVSVDVCPQSASDTIATLYYRTLVGSRLAPWVQLRDVATTNACQSAAGIDTATVVLNAPGCELGTVLVRPFTAGIQSVYPNPATGTTVITFATIEDGSVGLILSDPLGRVVCSLANGDYRAGVYTASFNASALPSGMYYLELRAGGRRATRAVPVAR